jgi:hypothetical protein
MTDSKTNEVVEAMARAISLHTYANTKCGPATDCAEWEDMTDYDRVTYRRAARADLTASEPLLAQARAQAVEDAAKLREAQNIIGGMLDCGMQTGIVAKARSWLDYAEGQSWSALAQSEGEGKA